jgi:hypothetical protein
MVTTAMHCRAAEVMGCTSFFIYLVHYSVGRTSCQLAKTVVS